MGEWRLSVGMPNAEEEPLHESVRAPPPAVRNGRRVRRRALIVLSCLSFVVLLKTLGGFVGRQPGRSYGAALLTPDGGMQGSSDNAFTSPWHTHNTHIDVDSNLTLSSASFPAEIAKNVYKYTLPLDRLYPYEDPHRGELSSKLRRYLETTPEMRAPPRPKRLDAIPRHAWQYHEWTVPKNGSRSRAADAEYPEWQEQARDWRTGDFLFWKPPLQNLTHARSQPVDLPRIQHDFANAARFSGRDGDEEREHTIATRRQLVKNVFLRCWQGYKDHAWGSDELLPVSGAGKNNFNGWGATIVDSLDTLLIMGLVDEYNLARNHVYDVDFHLVGGERSAYGEADGKVPVFETGIRYLGGLLSAYDLTGDDLMKERAEELAQLILPEFETLSGLPVGRMQLDDDTPYTAEKPRGFHHGVVLAEAGSMLLEFSRLWQATGNRTYFDTVQRVTDYFDRNLTQASTLGTLLPTILWPESRTSGGVYTLGGMADSYYEYLIKGHQLLGGKLSQYARMYSEAMQSAIRFLLREVHVVPHAESLIVPSETSSSSKTGDHYSAKLEHLACFGGGMFALGSQLLPERAGDLNIARRYTESCYWAYNSSATGLGPEHVEFYKPFDKDLFDRVTYADGTIHRGAQLGFPYTGVRSMSRSYQNRPETIESVLYMWRITGDEEWRERGWQMFVSWVTHALTPSGIAALADVLTMPPQLIDSMESYTLAETLKYYYLLFSPPQFMSFDDYVFTTEAHPLLAPKHGRWARAGSAPGIARWTPPGAPPPGEYAGGEMERRGGMSHVQKHELLEHLRTSALQTTSTTS